VWDSMGTAESCRGPGFSAFTLRIPRVFLTPAAYKSTDAAPSLNPTLCLEYL
jgi:hypothetical protein